MGRSQTFEHVAKIFAYAGGGNDTIIVKTGVQDDAYLDGGDGNDTLIYNGSGSVTLVGGNGDDYLEVGGDASGYVVMDGGANDDYLLNNSNVIGGVAPSQTEVACSLGTPPAGLKNQMCGGSGNDTLIGSSAGSSYLSGGSGTDSITVNGASDVVYAGADDDIVQMTLPTTAIGTVRIHGGGGGANDILTLAGTNGADAVVMSSIPNGMQIVRSGQFNGTLGVDGFHEVDLVLNGGADTVTLNDLQGSSVKTVSIDVGQTITTTGTRLVKDPDSGYLVQQPIVSTAPDRAADIVTLNGNANDDSFTLSGNDPDTGISIVHTAKSGSTQLESVQIYVKHTRFSEGDTLKVYGLTGNDLIDASLLGSPTSGTQNVVPINIVKLEEYGNEGNDRLIGSPFDDRLDGGTGSDTYTGGTGLDTFFDVLQGNDVNTLIETQDADIGLYGDTFVVGTLLTDDGTQGYAAGAGQFIGEGTLQSRFKNEGDPNFRTVSSGENWRGDSTVEDLKGLFAVASIKGGANNNTLVVNASDSSIFVGGVARKVTQWNGHVTLDNMTNSQGNLDPEHYVIAVLNDNTAQIDIIDSGGNTGEDELVLFGSPKADTIELTAAGSGAASVGFVTASVTATTSIIFTGIERVEVYMLGGNDTVQVDDTGTVTVIDMGEGDDNLIVGTVPLIPDPATARSSSRTASRWPTRRT